MNMLQRLVTIGLAAALSAPALAQTGDVTGTWAVKSEARKSEGWNIGALSGTLTLALKGRDITGTWKGPVRPEPWTLAGELKDGKFEARSERKDVNATRDDTNSTERVRWVFRGSVTGDAMTGTMTLERDGGESLPQPFKATRQTR